MRLTFNVCTIFPEMFESPFRQGVISRALKDGILALNLVNIRDYTEDKHRSTDDYQYGGGVGLVMKPEPICRAVEGIRSKTSTYVILMDPAGEKFTQKTAERLARCDNITLICGRYEGVDERVRELAADESLSVGDFVLTGGELAAMAVIDAVSRLIPGVLGDGESASEESYTSGYLEYPHYTRPVEYKGLRVPDVLLNGNHKEIEAWRHKEALNRTESYRYDLLPFTELSPNIRREICERTRYRGARKKKIAVALLHYPMRDKQGDLVCASITNMDLHDISRSCGTFGADRYFVVTPSEAQREIAARIIGHWTKGWGASYNENRKEAFKNTELCASYPELLELCEKLWGERPLVVATTAKERTAITARVLGEIAETRPVLLLFGTGWGFHESVYDMADYVLEPIEGTGEFKHLSVRSAVALILERITTSG